MSTTLELMRILDSSDLVPIYEYLCMKSNKALAIELVKIIKRIKSLEKHVERLDDELKQLRAPPPSSRK